MFDTLPAWAKVLLVVGVVLIGLAILGPIIKAIIDILFIVIVLGIIVVGGFFVVRKLLS